MQRLRRRTRLQHFIIESFPSRGTKPSPIWNLRELEPDTVQRARLQRLISRVGVSQGDFLRWRNACVAPDLKTALDCLCRSKFPTPLWVTSHLLRRKVNNRKHASLAAHLALLAVPSDGCLVPAHETPLLLAFGHVIEYNLSYALPAVTSRILALPAKHHEYILGCLTRLSVTYSPLVLAALQMVIWDAMKRSVIIPQDLWLRVWRRWKRKRSLEGGFYTWLEARMWEQGIHLPHGRNSTMERTYTIGATYNKPHTPPKPEPYIQALIAAAHAKGVSARMLLGTAHSLLCEKFPERTASSSHIDAAFISALINGLVWRKAYTRAQAVWEDAERRIGQPMEASASSPTNPQSSPPMMELTPPLLEAGLSAYIMAGNYHYALEMLEKYGKVQHSDPEASLRPVLPSEPRSLITPSAIGTLISHLPPYAQQIVFTHASRRWGVHPDSLALEAVMQSAMQTARVESKHQAWNGGNSFGDNVREFREGFRQLFGGRFAKTPLIEESDSRSSFISGSSSLTDSFGFNRSDFYTSSDRLKPTHVWSRYKSQLDMALNSALQVRDKATIRQNAINLFRSSVLENWPFIVGESEHVSSTLEGRGKDNLLAPSTMALFIPRPLYHKKSLETPAIASSLDPQAPSVQISFTPTPLHPSPFPLFPNAHPTRRAWSAYLALIPPESLPEALGWMRAADEFMQPGINVRTDDEAHKCAALNNTTHATMFRPERMAVIDALVRWEGAVLASESPVDRAWNERIRRAQSSIVSSEGENDMFEEEEIGKEGALRMWLVDWLGPRNVPSREEVASARVGMAEN